PFPALDWHYIDRFMKVGGIVGMDNAELRPVREHCEFLEENGTYRLEDVLWPGDIVRTDVKLADQDREWIAQAYGRAKRDPVSSTLGTRAKRKLSKWIKPYLY